MSDAPEPCLDEESAASYVDGDLPEERRLQVERHLESCESCLELVVVAAGLRRARASRETRGARPCPPPELPGIRERYSVLGEHARGGQARILVAFDENVGREVALKELLPRLSMTGTSADGSSWRDAVERFLREAELTGKLAHPGVVPVFEIGQRPDGGYFYSMQLVRGSTLSEVLHERPRLQDRLGLLGHFLSVCQVVAYAHSRGIVHRDIKPQNIMVGEFGETVLLDWGLAKQEGDEPDGDPAIPQVDLQAFESATRDGDVIGTPGYMSPEQACGKRAEVDERSDIYGLGAVLFEILDERPPPARRGPDSPLRSSGLKKAPPELLAVAEKALAFRKEDRYARASELAQDVTAFMTGGRVKAYSYSSWHLMRRFAARHRFLLGALGAISAVVLSALILISIAWRSELSSRRAAETRGRDALQEGAKLALSQGDPLQARAKVRGALELGDSLASRALWGKLRSNPVRLRARIPTPAQSVAFSPDGKQLAIGMSLGRVEIIDALTGAPIRVLSENEDQIIALAYSPDGRFLAWSSFSGRIAIEDLEQLTTTHLDSSETFVHVLAFSPDGALLAMGRDNGSVALWDVRRRISRPILANQTARVSALAFAPDGARLVACIRGKSVLVWDLAVDHKAQIPGGFLAAALLGSDGSILATGDFEGSISLWSLPEKRLLRTIRGHRDPVGWIAPAADGRQLVSTSFDGAVRLWRLPDGEAIRNVDLDGLLSSAAPDKDGRLIAASTSDSIWIVDLNTPVGTGHPRRPYVPYQVARFSPSGARIAAASDDGTISIWDEAGEQRASWREHSASIFGLCFSPDGRLLASAGYDGVVLALDAETGSVRFRFSSAVPMMAIACSPDNRSVATADTTGLARVWDTTSQKEVRMLGSKDPSSSYFSLSYLAGGQRIAAGRRNKIEVWDVGTGKLIRSLSGEYGRVLDLVMLEPAVSLMASASSEGSILFLNLLDGSSRLLGKAGGRVYRLGWDRRSRRLAAASSTGEILVWDTATGELSRRFKAHCGEVNSVDFAPDGRTAVSAGDDATLRLWETETWQPKWYTRAVVWTPELQVLTHRGWSALDPAGKLVPIVPPEAAWRRAVKSARQASMVPGGPLCVAAESGLTLWDTSKDQLLEEAALETPFEVAPLPDGCGVLKDGRVAIHRPGSPPIEVANGITQVAGGEVLAAIGARVALLDGLGRAQGEFGSGERVTAVASLEDGGGVAVGFRDGRIEVRARGPRPPVSFQEMPSSEVTRLLAGPGGTLIAGFADGSVGVWDSATGERLESGAVHGAVRQLLLERGILVVASEVGSTAVMDLSPLTAPYCELLRELWSRVPVAWRGQGAVLQEPDPGHACMKSRKAAAP